MTTRQSQDLVWTILTDPANTAELLLGAYGLTAFSVPAGWPALNGIFFEVKVRADDTWGAANINGVPIAIPAGGGLAGTRQILDPPLSGVYSCRACSGVPGAKINLLADQTIIPRVMQIYGRA